MSARESRRVRSSVCLAMVGIGWGLWMVPAVLEGSTCRVSTRHAGESFPMERLNGNWLCRIEAVVTNYTTANKLGPIRTPMEVAVYDFFLDHPSVAAALINRLDLGLHKAEELAADRFWVTDGEGTEGVVQRFYRDQSVRMYYIEGTHDGRFLPAVSGKAIVFLRSKPVGEGTSGAGPRGPAMETTVVSYIQVNNRVLSGLLSLFRPLVGKVVTRQLYKAFETAARLGGLVRDAPGRVLFEAIDPPPLPGEAIEFLHARLDIPARLQATPSSMAHP